MPWTSARRQVRPDRGLMGLIAVRRSASHAGCRSGPGRIEPPRCPTVAVQPSLSNHQNRKASHLDLYEYQGKQFFARFGIPVSAGDVASTVEEAVTIAERVGYPVVVKAQVQVGGLGKAGGIKLANDATEVRTHAGNI